MIHAAGFARQAPAKPMTGTRKRATAVRATISKTPASMATLVYPMPWMESLRMLTNRRGI